MLVACECDLSSVNSIILVCLHLFSHFSSICKLTTDKKIQYGLTVVKYIYFVNSILTKSVTNLFILFNSKFLLLLKMHFYYCFDNTNL